MSKLSLGSIKRESIRAIFSQITHNETITRLRIAESTGLSLMTVGKVIDVLLEKEMIIQEKQMTSEVGRKAGVVSLNRDNRIIILDLTSRKFVLGVYDLALDKLHLDEFTFDSCIPYFDNLRRYMYLVKKYINMTKDTMRTIGICVSAPGVYDPAADLISNKRIPELNTIFLKKTIEGILGYPVDYIDRNARLAAISNIENIPDYDRKVAVYIHIGEGVGGTIMINGDIVIGLNNLSGEVANLIISEDGKTLEEILTKADLPKRLVYINKLIYNIIWHIDPHHIIIEYDNLEKDSYELFYKNLEKIPGMFEHIKRTLPEIQIVSPSIQHSHRGACIVMREKWIENEL